jgi:DeoR family transcriptional regulator of aga operon
MLVLVEKDPDALGTDERRDRILALVESSGFARVVDLSAAFGVSTVTVRSDLDALAERGAVRRIRGGAMATDGAALRERPFEEVQVEAVAEKAKIATAAVDLIDPGMRVILDVGTTAAAIAQELLRSEQLTDVTVITSGLSIALMLEPAIPRLQVIVSGGALRPLQHTLVSPLGTVVLQQVHADIAFIGCNGIDAVAGVTNVNLPEAEIKRAMIASAAEVVVVADGSKVGRARLGMIAPATDVDMLITDASAPRSALDELRALDGPHVVVA